LVHGSIMILQIYGTERAIDDCLSMSGAWPEKFQPVYFGTSENRVNKSRDRCSDLTLFERFKIENPLGYYLHSKSCVIDVKYSGYNSALFIEVKNKNAQIAVAELLRFFSHDGIHYAFACKWDEWRYKNGLVKSIGDSYVENWVGRDFKKYLPSLYWLNLIPNTMFLDLNIDKSLLLGSCESSVELPEGFNLLKMYKEPDDWMEYAPRLDSLCEDIDGIFSKWSIWDSVENIEELDTYLFEVSKWK